MVHLEYFTVVVARCLAQSSQPAHLVEAEHRGRDQGSEVEALKTALGEHTCQACVKVPGSTDESQIGQGKEHRSDAAKTINY